MTIFNNKKNLKANEDYIPPYIVERVDDMSLSIYLGIFGMTGLAAYFGVTEILKPKKYETIVISAAAGGVGIIVGQIALVLGCRVIGLTGTEVKCEWLRKQMRFHVAINYKMECVDEILKIVAPEGVDMYFDNVGGEISSIVMNHLKTFGRVAVCGCISTYNSKVPVTRKYQQ